MPLKPGLKGVDTASMDPTSLMNADPLVILSIALLYALKLLASRPRDNRDSESED